MAAHHEQLGVEHVHHRRHDLSERAPGIVDRPPAGGVAVARRRQHRLDRQVVAVGGAQPVDQRARARHGLQAAAVAAPADDPARVDEHVAELAGEAAGAPVEPAVEDEPGADPRGDLEVDQVAGVAPGAERRLGQRAEVRVVVDHHRDVEPAAHLGLRGHADPARQDRRPAHDALAGLDRPGQAHAGADHRGAVDAGVGERLLDELRRGVQALLRVMVGVERLRPLGQDRRGEVGHRHAQVRVAEVDPDGRAGRGVEGQQDRRPAALRSVRQAGLWALDHQPVSLQVGDQAGDRRARQPRPPGDLSARDLPLLAQRADHAQPVEAAEGFQGAGATLGHRRSRLDRIAPGLSMFRTNYR